MEPDALRLADALDELASFLATNGERSSADWVAMDAQRVRSGDGYGVTHFLAAFGSMGILDDLVFDPISGNSSAEEASRLNELFAQLRRAAWEQAEALRHDILWRAVSRSPRDVG